MRANTWTWARRRALGTGIAAGVALRSTLGMDAPAVWAAPTVAPAAQRAPAAGRPMYQQDGQHSGRSPHVGPVRPVLARTFDTTSPGIEVPAGTNADIQSSTAVGGDGTIYQTTFSGALFALRDPGFGGALQPRWWFRPDDSTSAHATPAVADDGTVYLAYATRTNPTGTLYAVRAPRSGSQGEVAWSVALGPGRTTYSPVIGPDGTVYMVSGGGVLYAVAPFGDVAWTAQAGPVSRAAPSIAADGSVYVPSLDGNLYAVAPPTSGGREGRVGWTFDFTAHSGSGPLVTGQAPVGGNGVGSGSCAAIGRDGTLYVGANNSNFYAIRVDGSLKWMFEAEREVAGIWADPALSADERTVYFGANKGGVYAVDTATGALRWQFPIFGSLYGGMTLDRAGTLYTGSSIGRFFAINTANGLPYFDYDAQSFPGIWTAPCILPNGSAVISNRRGQVMLFAA